VVLGEAARRLSEELRARHPDVPRREIIGLRSIVTYRYDPIDDDELSQVIDLDLAQLVIKLEAIPAVP
jgi:uncharacterized protein with HEPN domain